MGSTLQQNWHYDCNDSLTETFFSFFIEEGRQSEWDTKSGDINEIGHKNEHKTAFCRLDRRPYAILHAIRIPRGEILFNHQS